MIIVSIVAARHRLETTACIEDEAITAMMSIESYCG